MEKIQESDITIYKEDVLHTYEYIDVIEMDSGYRIHDVCSGIILKTDTFTAYIIKLLYTEMSYFELLNRLQQDLPELQIDIFLINGILEYFIDIRFISIQRKKYKTRILLINPCYRYANNVYREISIVPPLGILCIATRLFRAGYHVSILDMLLNDIRPEEVGIYVQNENPDIVGISMNFTSTANVCYEIAENIKKIGIRHIFVGGNHATFTYQEAIRNSNIDYVVRYQGEQTVLELVEIIRTEKWFELNRCKGLVYENDGKIIVNEKRKNTDINEREIPAWHLLDIYKYKEDSRWSLNTSQGCPCACAFCSTTAFNNKMYFMTVKNIIKLLKKIQRIEGGKQINISFSDDAFTCHKQRVIELCNWIIKNNMKVLWACSTRVDLVNEELLRLMYNAGCRAVLFGIESCSNETLQKVGKKINIEQAERAVLLAKEAGMRVKEMFILGLPYETKETTRLIEKFIIKTKPDEVRFGMLSMYPGTPIWNEAEKYGINLLTDNWGDYDLLRPTTNNSFLKEDEIYKQYIEFTELYEKINEDTL